MWVKNVSCGISSTVLYNNEAAWILIKYTSVQSLIQICRTITGVAPRDTFFADGAFCLQHQTSRQGREIFIFNWRMITQGHRESFTRIKDTKSKNFLGIRSFKNTAPEFVYALHTSRHWVVLKTISASTLSTHTVDERYRHIGYRLR